jgi:hypothetical protein
MKIKLPYIPRPDKQPKWIKREPPDPYESAAAAADPEQPFAQPSQVSHQISQVELNALLDA